MQVPRTSLNSKAVRPLGETRLARQNEILARRAVVLLSGGLDSATILAIAKEAGRDCFCLTFDYGQRHHKEIDAARSLATWAGASHEILSFQLPWKGSALLDEGIRLAKDRALKEMAQEIPATYVPARNTIFLSFAASWAETIQAPFIYFGANAIDYSGYPDCRQSYLLAFQRLLALGTKSGVLGKNAEILAPLVNKTKAEIVRWGMRLGVPYELTWSCYAGKELPCQRCDSCLLRAKAFQEVGIDDPLLKKSHVPSR